MTLFTVIKIVSQEEKICQDAEKIFIKERTDAGKEDIYAVTMRLAIEYINPNMPELNQRSGKS